MVGLTSAQLLGHLAAAARAADDSTTTMWYLTRAMAFGAYVFLSLSVMLGALRSVARMAGERLSWTVDELHQVTATLAGALVIGHLVTLLLDPYLPFSLANLLLPFSEPYRPLPVRLGVFALYGMALLLATSWLRRRMRYRLWRGIHYLSFVAFALATAHGLFAGSDGGEPWMRAVYGGAGAAVAFLVVVRLFVGAPAVPREA